jgi:spermidine/putrescine transport system ATP-binding protein
MATRTSGDLTLVGVSKEFETFTAVHPLDLTVPAGSFFALLGPSGCGKTTTLRMVAGLEEPTTGKILIGEDDITDTRAFRRNVNTVFQSYALFPHMTVIENVEFGLKRKGDRNAAGKAKEALELVQLDAVASKKPAQLSGGMQQRVALARAIVNRPDVLLLDEPLGALDLKLRRQMQIELKRIQSEVGLTFIHVTHDQEEAMTMADSIAVMNAGRIEQQGDPATLYEHPESVFVANFLGQSNLLRASLVGTADGQGSDGQGSDGQGSNGQGAAGQGTAGQGTAGQGSGGRVRVNVQGHHLEVEGSHVPSGTRDLWLGVRPEKLRLGDHGGPNQLQGVVVDASFTGVATQYIVRLPWDQEITVVQQNDGSARAKHGENVTISWASRHGFVLDAAEPADSGLQPSDG